MFIAVLAEHAEVYLCNLSLCLYNALQHISGRNSCAIQSVEGSLLFSEGMIQKRERNNIYSGYKLA